MSTISEILVDEATLKKRVQELGAEISRDYKASHCCWSGC